MVIPYGGDVEKAKKRWGDKEAFQFDLFRNVVAMRNMCEKTVAAYYNALDVQKRIEKQRVAIRRDLRKMRKAIVSLAELAVSGVASADEEDLA